MGTLIDKIEEVAGSNIWVTSSGRIVSQIGTPLVSLNVSTIHLANAFPDTYTLTFEDVVPGVSATVIVSTGSQRNPFNKPEGYTVLLDGNTSYTYVIPSLILIFSDDVGFLSSWEAVIKVGRHDGRAPNYGAFAGVPRTERKHQILNDGESTAFEVTVKVETQIQLVEKMGELFSFIDDFAPDAIAKIIDGVISKYAITVEDVTGIDENKIGTLKVDNELINVLNKTTGLTSTSEGINVVDIYMVVDGNLKDWVFKLHEGMSNGSTANIFVIPNDFIEVAADDGGSPDVFSSEQLLGDLGSGSTFNYWERITIPALANFRSNIYLCKILITALGDEAADWGG